MMTTTGYKKDDFAFVKDWGNHCDIRKMRSSGQLRMVRHKDLRIDKWIK
jgi:hypothetical protein